MVSRTPSATSIAMPEQAITFGSFVLLPQQQLLFKNQLPVLLGNRAMSLLIALATRSGESLEKSELIGLAWPNVVVEECNLRAQIRTLRRTLADEEHTDFIVTVPRIGYRFVVPVDETTSAQTCMSIEDSEQPAGPTRGPVYGRAALIQQLVEQLKTHRLMTIAGPGGIGKTTVAHAIAQAIPAKSCDAVFFVDLAPVTTAHLVPGMVTSAMGVNSATSTPLQSITSTLGDSSFLLVLDNCEHLLEVVATVAETILRNAPRCRILTTSREPLNTSGECVHYLAPLRVPDAWQNITPKQALTYSGVQLFVEHVTACDAAFIFESAHVEAVIDICRKLDGNPLALEIAAARVHALGIRSLNHLLGGRFRLQMPAQPLSSARHRTLNATLDWSYSMLSVHEQTMLRYLSVFAGPFTIEAAAAITNAQVIHASAVLPLLESLVDKSLLTVCEPRSPRRFRLLETTRAYAFERSLQQQEMPGLRRTQASFAVALLRQAGDELHRVAPHSWLERYAPEIDNLRAALTWAYATAGDRDVGINLTLLALPLWLRLSLIGECRHWVDMGLIDVTHSQPILPGQRMLLLTAAASVSLLSNGAGPLILEFWHQVLEDAIALDDTEHQLRALWGLWSEYTCRNQNVPALELADQYVHISQIKDLPHHRLLAKRIQATSLFYMGHLVFALESVNEALSAPLSASAHVIDMHFDQRIAARCVKAHIQLLQGQTEQSLQVIDDCVAQAITAKHPATLWYTLCFSALPMALVAGDLNRLRDHLNMMNISIARHDLPIWRQLAGCFNGVLLIRQGDLAAGVRLLNDTLGAMFDHGASPFYSLLRSEYVQGLALQSNSRQAMEVLDETLHCASSSNERWYLPELLRVKALLLRQNAAPASNEDAHNCLSQALAEADRQGAELWRTRILEARTGG